MRGRWPTAGGCLRFAGGVAPPPLLALPRMGGGPAHSARSASMGIVLLAPLVSLGGLPHCREKRLRAAFLCQDENKKKCGKGGRTPVVGVYTEGWLTLMWSVTRIEPWKSFCALLVEAVVSCWTALSLQPQAHGTWHGTRAAAKTQF